MSNRLITPKDFLLLTKKKWMGKVFENCLIGIDERKCKTLNQFVFKHLLLFAISTNEEWLVYKEERVAIYPL